MILEVNMFIRLIYLTQIINHKSKLIQAIVCISFFLDNINISLTFELSNNFNYLCIKKLCYFNISFFNDTYILILIDFI